MDMPGASDVSRRALLAALAAGALPGSTRAATPACGRAATEAQTEGPYYRRSSPERASLLEPGMQGDRLLLEGRVLDRDCRPIPRALLDFWQCDPEGAYDNRGFRLRGHLFADGDGRFRLETILPGPYPGRTRHVHVKVQPPSGRVLTTQLYFPGEPLNARDGLFDPALLLNMAAPAVARFDFVL